VICLHEKELFEKRVSDYSNGLAGNYNIQFALITG